MTRILKVPDKRPWICNTSSVYGCDERCWHENICIDGDQILRRIFRALSNEHSVVRLSQKRKCNRFCGRCDLVPKCGAGRSSIAITQEGLVRFTGTGYHSHRRLPWRRLVHGPRGSCQREMSSSNRRLGNPIHDRSSAFICFIVAAGM